MYQFSYLFLIGIIVAFVAACLIFARLKSKTGGKQLPQSYIGAIRVTDRQGRDMLIIRKEDGSFEMHEEQKIRND